MNKTAIKNFAIWARNKLIAEIIYKAGLLGITENEIKSPLPQSSKDVQFFDIGTREPYSITGVEIEQRAKLAEAIQQKEEQSDYKTAFKNVVEEVAYTWFNRLIAVRFMEVNDYLPSRTRVLSSDSSTKIEPDLVTTPFDADLEYTPYEKDRIMQLKHDNKLDELFRMLFIKQCNTLNAILPELFEKTNDYTELLLNVSFTDKDGVVYHLVNDIPEDVFNVEKEGQVEIIGWLYQYYNTGPKNETFELLKKNIKITKERIPAATQLFTPDWIVRYMVENSLGRLWLEGHPNDDLKAGWMYYLDEAEQEPEVQAKLNAIREGYKVIKPEDIKVIDPCMGSGHILVYAFDVLMKIYESYGYSQRDAAKSIIEKNLYGLDIDNRAYQLAYFAVIMKARQYNRRILDGQIGCHVHAIRESNGINHLQLKYFGYGMSELERNTAIKQIEYLLDTFKDANEYGSILNINNLNWDLLYRFTDNVHLDGQISLYTVDLESTKKRLTQLVKVADMMAQNYDVIVTNPPYMGNNNMSSKLSNYVKKNYFASKSDLFAVFIERCLNMSKPLRYISLITMHSWMSLSSFEALRKKILNNAVIKTINHLGMEAFDGVIGKVVSTVAFCMLTNTQTIEKYQGKAVRLVDFYDSQRYLKESQFFQEQNRFLFRQNDFKKIPGLPIAYWVSEKMQEIFCLESTLEDYGIARQGLGTSDNNRFLRIWFEVDILKISFNCSSCEETKERQEKWYPFIKGGNFRRWHPNKEYVVNYQNNGFEIKKSVMTKYPYLKTPDFVVKNTSTYFNRGITWNDVSTGLFSARFVEDGYIYADAGPMFFASKAHESILAYMNSCVFQKFVDLVCQGMHYSTGQIPKIPFLQIIDSDLEEIELTTKQNISISQVDWNSYETSWNFKRHPFLEFCCDKSQMYTCFQNESLMSFNRAIKGGCSIENSFIKWMQFTEEQFNQLKANEEKLNRYFIQFYGLQDELTPEVDDKNVTIRRAELGRDARSFISYAVGCIFGRYTLDMDGLVYAGGKWDISKYSTFIPDKDNIIPITDEEYFKDDIVDLFCSFVKKTFGSKTLEGNLDFIAQALGNKGKTSREVIRNYFLKDFFTDHCKVYQKRPIYWLFDSGKAYGFKALVYMHRYNEDTIGKLRIDYLHRMQHIYESEIAQMQDTIDKSSNTREVNNATKRKEKLIKQLKETKEYDEKIAHLALARISIDLDDGVKVNYHKVQTDVNGNKIDVLAKI